MGAGERPAVELVHQERYAWATTTRPACGVQRHTLGLSHRCTLVGPARPLSALPNLPSVLPSMVQGGDLGPGAPSVGQGLVGQREDRYQRMLHRWHLRKCQKRGRDIGPTKKGKGTKIMAVADAHGLPIAIRTFGASTHEVKLAARTIQSAHVKPKRVIGDKAYDSDQLDERMRKKGVKLIAPHRHGRKRKATQDGRQLRRYCRRWKIERLFSWVFNQRRTVVRYEYHVKNYLGFVQIACILILSRQLF